MVKWVRYGVRKGGANEGSGEGVLRRKGITENEEKRVSIQLESKSTWTCLNPVIMCLHGASTQPSVRCPHGNPNPTQPKVRLPDTVHCQPPNN